MTDTGGEGEAPVRVKEVGTTSVLCPMLTSTNYTVWAMRMKVVLRIHKAWTVIDPGTDVNEEKDCLAMGLLYQALPENLIMQIGDQDSAKKLWDAIRARNVGADRVKEARLQTLMSEFDRLKMLESETIDSFAGKLSGIASTSSALGETIEESKLVKKFLKSLPRNFIHIVASLEQVLDLKSVGFEDVVGRLKAYEERIREVDAGEGQSRVLFAEKSTGDGGGSSTGGGNSSGTKGNWKGSIGSNKANEFNGTNGSSGSGYSGLSRSGGSGGPKGNNRVSQSSRPNKLSNSNSDCKNCNCCCGKNRKNREKDRSKESSGRYLFNDSCVFGAEVFVVPLCTQQDRCLSMIKPPPTMNTYSGTIEKFSSVKEEKLVSEVFKVGKVKWTLSLYPKGNKTGADTHLSIYLRVHEAVLLPADWRVYGKFEIRVKKYGGYDHSVIGTDVWFSKSARSWGYADMMKLSELHDKTKGFLFKDRLIVETKISAVGIQKNFM
ncbi:unnamed protein product [Lactuca saligna]|uniref:MATH domain-containing protein n=1 Tax=Lactuca saligna TaxID=75948 RepID=A0AA36A3Y6_LACSI|nr:unnamed protein product [Lactuca saligna]